jgi:hypothetical protein
VVALALSPTAPLDSELANALSRLKADVHADCLEFCREIGFRLPAALEAVTVSEIRQHLGAFLEHTFRNWAERESEELRVALSTLSERVLATASQANAAETGEPRSSAGPDSRLQRPALEVSTFALDASVVASLAIGVGALFANVALGGLFLLAAPTLATLGREHGERALRRRAAESAMKAIEDAARDLSAELARVIDEFGHRIAPSGAASG